MGQRHQVYLFLRDDKGYLVKRAFHHQWLYGYSAGIKVIEVMKYAKKAFKSKYHPWSNCSGQKESENSIQCLMALYRLDIESGDYSGSISSLNNFPGDKIEENCVADPRECYNNDGITVFDFRDPKKPMYCMVNIRDFNPEWNGISSLTSWTVHTIGEYVRAYYPQEKIDNELSKQDKKKIEKVFKESEKLLMMGNFELEQLFPKVFLERKKN